MSMCLPIQDRTRERRPSRSAVSWLLAATACLALSGTAALAARERPPASRVAPAAPAYPLQTATAEPTSTPPATLTPLPTSTPLPLPPVVEPGATPTRVATGFTFTEGPAADRVGNVYFSDVRTSRIHKWSLDGTVSVYRENTNSANGLYFDLQGRLVACEQGASPRISRDDLQGNVVTLVDSYNGKRINSPNDLWIDPKGGVYFSDPRYGDQSTVEQDGFHVYYLPPDGRPLIRVTTDIVQPNGVIGKPDGSMLYVADPGQGQNKTWKYRIQPDGTLADKTLFVPRGADGVAIDRMGNIYLANGNQIWVYSSAGALIQSIPFPEAPSNVAFGGPDRQTLFVTARTSFYSLRMAVKGADTVWDYDVPLPTDTPGTPPVRPTAPTPLVTVSSVPATRTPQETESPLPPPTRSPTRTPTPTAGQAPVGRIFVPVARRGE